MKTILLQMKASESYYEMKNKDILNETDVTIL